MNLKNKRYDDGTTPQDYAEDATCPNCESENINNPNPTCDDCGWSIPNLSMTKVTGDHRPYYRCDHCGSEMFNGPCMDCMETEGVPDDE